MKFFVLNPWLRRATCGFLGISLVLALSVPANAQCSVPGSVKSGLKLDSTNTGLNLIPDGHYGRGLTYLPDLDGDGFGELVATSRMAPGGGTERGEVYFLSLNPGAGYPLIYTLNSNHPMLSGLISNMDRFGSRLANLGDLDGNGYPELAVGAELTSCGSNSGRAYVLFLNSINGGLVTSVHTFDCNTVPIVGGRFASDVGGADVDGDGEKELLVGQYFHQANGKNQIGKVWIFDWDDGTNAFSLLSEITEGVGGFPFILEDGDKFGTSVEGIGDLDGDGLEEIAVTANTTDVPFGPDHGAVYILFMNGDGTVRSARKHTSATTPGITSFDAEALGSSLANLGDLDGDGLPELGVGVPQRNTDAGNEGAALILFLDAKGGVRGVRELSNLHGCLPSVNAFRDEFGTEIQALGDQDGDGITDIAVSAAIGTANGSTGHVFLLHLNGVPAAEFRMKEPTPGVAGVQNTFSVRGAGPGNNVAFYYGFAQGSTGTPYCSGLTVDLQAASQAAVVPADASGEASFSAFIPPLFAGQNLFLQAVDLGACNKSQGIHWLF
ncbi:MAG: hypothetical protein DWQ01_13510 [Planctomycetota bacterium]|nr:MAG: hypothetical protein DWQ01_13510 [Planctomycetota bacterium]